MSAATCIYCTKSKPLEQFAHTEHVIPKAFSKGFRGALTLTQTERPSVCDDCNQRFGESLEFALGRDTFEAVLRLQYGAKPAGEAGDVGQSRLEITLPEDSKHGPLRVEFRAPPSGDQPALIPKPQARFRRRAGGFVCLTEEDLVEKDPTKDPEIDTDEVFIVWSGDDPEAGERVRATLSAYGVKPKKWTDADDLPRAGTTEVEIEIRGIVDQVIARAIAKMAFNYLAWVSFGFDRQFALRDDFDPIRAFILHGENHWREFVLFPAPNILATDSEVRRSTQGHLITLEWKRFEGIASQVSVFNDLTYRVALAKRTRGIWRDIGSGHHYNPITMKVEKLGRTPLSVPGTLVIP